MNVSDQLVRSGKYAERGRCMAIVDDTILGFSQLIIEAGPNYQVTVETIIDSLLIARGLIENEHSWQQGHLD